MADASAPTAPTFGKSRWIRFGLVGLVLGTGPLLLAVAISYWRGDNHPNPVGPGLLAMVTFWPSVSLILIGVVLTIVRRVFFARSQR